MLVIREAQMRMLGAALRGNFVLRLTRHLSLRFPGRPLDDLRRLASASVDEGRGLGFSTEEDLTRFAEFAALFGSPLSKVSAPAWISRILQRSDLTPSGKLDVLDNHYTFDRSND